MHPSRKSGSCCSTRTGSRTGGPGSRPCATDAPGQFTLWPAGYPDFPLPQTLRADQADGRVIISCQVFAIDIVWQLAEASAGTAIHVNVTPPESQARRLDGQHQLIEESLRRLTALAEAP